MARNPLFTEGHASDIAYVNIREAGNDYLCKARENCEFLWALFEPHSDPEFVVEMKSAFDARYWEMYLTTYLIQEGYDVLCPKPGPDVGITFNGCRIWFEATSPTRGAEGAPDRVPERQYGIVQDVPNDRMILRYLNSISDKYHRQYTAWIRNGIVKPQDAFVIAINPRQLGFDFSDTEPPRILQTAFAVGNPYVTIDVRTMRQVTSGYQFRNNITKLSGSSVATGVFHLNEYSGLSGLLCSRVDVVNQPVAMGAGFQLVPNPWATVRLPDGFRLKGTYYRIEQTKEGCMATPELASP